MTKIYTKKCKLGILAFMQENSDWQVCLSTEIIFIKKRFVVKRAVFFSAESNKATLEKSRDTCATGRMRQNRTGGGHIHITPQS